MAGRSKAPTSETRHIVQPYVLRKQRGRQAALVPADPLPVRNAQAARLRAEKLYATGRYAGVDAYSVTCDEEAGEYGEPVFHARLGRVPEHEE